MQYDTEEISLKNGENTIFGIAYKPHTAERIPAVILSHGYNSSCFYLTDVAKILAENGVFAFCYDFCGGSTTSKSTGESVDMSIDTEKSDLMTVIGELSENYDFSDIYLYGESQGGFISALTAADIPERIAGMFLIYPALCIPDDWLSRSPESMNSPINFGGMLLSRKFYDSVPKFDIYEHIAKYKNPIYIYHGDHDPVVNLRYSQRLSELPNAALTVIKCAGHGFSAEDRAVIIEEICGLINERSK